MLGSTGRATPSPYNELSRTTGTTQASTAGTGSRCESLAHDDHRSAGVLALIPQHLPEHPPAAVEHGFGHPRFYQLRAAHIAHGNVLILIHDPAAELMQRVPAPVRRPAMQALRLTLVAAALGLGNARLDVAIEATALAASPIARDRHLLQPQVNAHRLFRCDGGLALHLHSQAEPPVPHRILGKAALAPFHPLQPLGLEEPKAFAAETYRPASAPQARRLERHPPE